MSFLAFFTALFSVVNPLGAIPLYISLSQHFTPQVRNEQVLKSSIYVVGILLTFLLAGSFILRFFSITIEGMRIAGGLMIIRSAYNMLDGNFKKGKAISSRVEQEAMVKEDISFSPMAMPMLAGPGSISLIISTSASLNHPQEYAFIIGAILLLAVSVYIIFRFSPLLFARLGEGGISAMQRIMGFIVLTVGIQFIINGVTPLLKTLLKG
ncbi:stress protection protein MarC [Sphingobacteriales bacterium UPWRP_1]|nr:stress protection protein MarC [Sphingobacteriales bacterium TSM_CSM]PSJ73084.1 stress protection protein MarC [Sphingobacteriales bacterium UPWRP_1]